MSNPRQLAIQNAASDDAILALGVVSAIHHFKMVHADVLAARDLAVATWPKERLTDVLGRNRQHRRYRALVKYEKRYPLIFRQTLANGEPYRVIAAQWKVSRQIAGRMVLEFKKYSADYGIGMSKLMAAVEGDCQKYAK